MQYALVWVPIQIYNYLIVYPQRRNSNNLDQQKISEECCFLPVRLNSQQSQHLMAIDHPNKLMVFFDPYRCNGTKRKRWRKKSEESWGRPQLWLKTKLMMSLMFGPSVRRTDGDSIGRFVFLYLIVCLTLPLHHLQLPSSHFVPLPHFSPALLSSPQQLESGRSSSLFPVCVIKSTNHQEYVSQRILSPQRAKT